MRKFEVIDGDYGVTKGRFLYSNLEKSDMTDWFLFYSYLRDKEKREYVTFKLPLIAVKEIE